MSSEKVCPKSSEKWCVSSGKKIERNDNGVRQVPFSKSCWQLVQEKLQPIYMYNDRGKITLKFDLPLQPK